MFTCFFDSSFRNFGIFRKSPRGRRRERNVRNFRGDEPEISFLFDLFFRENVWPANVKFEGLFG
jgi:hypothetical protein